MGERFRQLSRCALCALLGAMLVCIPLPAQHLEHKAGGHAGHMHKDFDPEHFAASFDSPERETWQKPTEVIAALQLKKGYRVADIGAGTGYFSVRLARDASAPKVYAVDIEPKMLDYIRKRATEAGLSNITTVEASENSPNLPEPVDRILVVNTYHHIPNRVAYFKALRKSLRPGGQVAIVDYTKDSPQGPPVEFRFTPEFIQGEMQKAGYKLAAKHDFLPNQNFLVFE